jgi:hypothetical protein
VYQYFDVERVGSKYTQKVHIIYVWSINVPTSLRQLPNA